MSTEKSLFGICVRKGGASGLLIVDHSANGKTRSTASTSGQ
ncbi:hypothetical protein [Sphingobacterium kitahiroshimense]